MTAVINPYSWKFTSFYHRIKQSFSLEVSPAASLIRELDEFQMIAPKYATLHKIVAYLTAHSDSRLQTALENKFKEASLSDVKASLSSIATYSLSTGCLKMLDVCQKIAGLHQLKGLAQVNDVIQLARGRCARRAETPKNVYGHF